MNDSKNEAKKLLQEIAKTLAGSVASINFSTDILRRGINPSPDDTIIQGQNDAVLIVESYVVNYVETIDVIKNNPKLQGMQQQLAEAGYSPFLIQEILIAIVTTGFSSDLSKEMHELKIVKKAIAGNLMAVDRALLGLATLMESTIDKPVDIVRETVIDNEEQIRTLQEHFTKYAIESGTDEKKINRFNKIFNQIFWRTKKQSGEALRGRCVTIVDKVAVKFGITSDNRRELCRKLSAVTRYEQADRIMYDMLIAGAKDPIPYEAFADGNDSIVEEKGNLLPDAAVSENARKSGPNVFTVGMTLLGIGGVTFIGGYTLQSNDQDSGWLVMTGGIVLLFLGIVTLSAGALAALAGFASKPGIKKKDNLL
jgi:hypothetical protein